MATNAMGAKVISKVRIFDSPSVETIGRTMNRHRKVSSTRRDEEAGDSLNRTG